MHEAAQDMPARRRARKSYTPITIGQRFGRLTILGQATPYIQPSSGAAIARWRARCDCGAEVDRLQTHLNKGASVDCGCTRKLRQFSLGERFGLLTVRGAVFDQAGKKRVPCQCDCGAETNPYSFNLASGKSQSCGKCNKPRPSAEGRARIGDANRRHGMHGTPEYNAWSAMKKRCLDPSHYAYSRYGGRGIGVHQAWVNDFAAFFAHIGARPSQGHSLDRIDNDLGYEPGNVRWADRSTQNKNRRAFTINRKPKVA